MVLEVPLDGTPLRLMLHISNAYPGQDGSLSANVLASKAGVNAIAFDQLCSAVSEFCETHGSSECLLEIIQLATEIYTPSEQEVVDSAASNDCLKAHQTVPAKRYRYLLRVDHMNSPKTYQATLCSWCAELDITGCILSCLSGRLGILILLDGTHAALKEYLCRHRTQYVDTDKRGKRCKERLLDVLLGPLEVAPGSRPCTTFEVIKPFETPAGVKDSLRSYAVEYDVR